MGLETVTYISDLVATNPASSDNRNQGDDHLRNIKAALLNTFPAVTGAVTASHTELNFVDGVTSAIQTQLDARVKVAGAITAVSALDVDCSAGTYFTKTVSTNSTFTFSNAPSGAYGFMLKIVHTSGTITLPGTVVWPNGVAPTLAAGKTHLLAFLTDNSGSVWRGAALPNYAS